MVLLHLNAHLKSLPLPFGGRHNNMVNSSDRQVSHIQNNPTGSSADISTGSSELSVDVPVKSATLPKSCSNSPTTRTSRSMSITSGNVKLRRRLTINPSWRAVS